MARSRNIKPGFFSNEDLVELDFATRLLFAGLWTVADRDGRLQDRPKKIKIDVFPADNLDIDAMLQALHNGGFIERYVVDGSKFIQISNWSKHQNPHHTEKASEIPGTNGVLTVKQPLEPKHPPKQDGGNLADSLLLIPDSLIPESKTAPAKRAAPIGFTPPNWINLQHWQAWHSSPKRKKATNDQKQMAVDKLDAWRQNGEDFAGALENAAVGGYQGLFLPDKKPSQSGATETAYQRCMREKMEVMAPAIAAKAPGVPRTNPNNFFDALPNAKPLEITQ